MTKRYFLTLLLGVASLCTASEPTSVCTGTPEKGRLEHGWKLPTDGKNFSAYSSIGTILGRTYVHSSVHEIVVTAYGALAKTHPEKRFVYGETGNSEGGLFKPHKTHQNGLSVDFMVPVLDERGESLELPSSPLNKFGYDIEFTAKGVYEDLRMDFDAIGAHLLALKQAADARGIKIRRVIFDNELQKLLFASKYGEMVKHQLTFSKKRPWVRHDEHYHVDFDVKCDT